MTSKTKMIRDALGSPVPQTLNDDGTYTVLANGDITGINFRHYKLLRDALGSPLPYQYYDVEQGKFVPGMIGGGGGGAGTVNTVNNKSPNASGNVTLTHTDVGASSTQDLSTLSQIVTDNQQEVTTHLAQDNDKAHTIDNIEGLRDTLNNLEHTTGVPEILDLPTPNGFTLADIKYLKSMSGLVELNITATKETAFSGQIILGDLPVGYRPIITLACRCDLFSGVNLSSAISRITVTSGGSIAVDVIGTPSDSPTRISQLKIIFYAKEGA